MEIQIHAAWPICYLGFQFDVLIMNFLYFCLVFSYLVLVGLFVMKIS